ncbi:hypothetical protein ACHAWF_001806 [Thalassiosira exigua]
MIALYYCYPPSGLSPSSLSSHASFHRDLGASLDLGGRIRVCPEGLNGVLSGEEEKLREYERRLRRELRSLADAAGGNDGGGATTTAAGEVEGTEFGAEGERGGGGIEGEAEEADDDDDGPDDRGGDPTAAYLDVKYCRLRPDLPAEDQRFDSLSVKITREVVSLVERSEGESQGIVTNNANGGNRKKGRARCRQRRRERRKEKLRAEASKGGGREDGLEEAASGGASDEAAAAESPPPAELGAALAPEGWRDRAPAARLSPRAWNEELLRLSRARGRRANGGNDDDGNDTNDADNDTDEINPREEESEDESDDDGEAVLLDARNVYESNVGHFAVPTLSTVFPNTRKFSSLPGALNTDGAARALSGKKVFMYCTGGVRCERAGSYLRAISEGDAGAWRGKDPPKAIYQLEGGIQRYLEVYGTGGAAGGDTVAEVASEGGGGEGPATRTHGDGSGKGADDPCLYRGKNFVFDPRRTDPVAGSGVAALGGKCLVCAAPHDDYDNGRPPREGGEARCRRCRVLVLVCDACRKEVRCWGEGDDGGGGAGEAELFCGVGGRECADEGERVERVETARF